MPIPRLHRPALHAGLAISAALAGAPSARAELGGTVSVQSDSRYRGVSSSERRPQAQLTLAYDDEGGRGWYGGALLTRMHFDGDRRSGLLQGYLGRVATLAPGLDAEVGVSVNHFDRISRYDYAEAYLGLLGERWNARLHYANDYYGSAQRSVYGELNLNWLLAPALQGFAHAGLIHGSGNHYRDTGGPTRLDWRAGAAWRLGLCELQLAWVGASRGGPYTWTENQRRQTLVLGLSASF